MPGKQSRRWQATLNNYTQADVTLLSAQVDDGHLTYLVMAKEIGVNQTPHLQMYLETPRKKTLSGLKSQIGINQLHLEIANGTSAQNLLYCSKGEQPKQEWEAQKEKGLNYGKNADVCVFGAPMIAGTNSLVKRACRMIESGKSAADIAREDLEVSLVYGKRIAHTLRLRRKQSRCWKSEVIVHYGSTGLGKTRLVFDSNTENEIYMHGGDRWFDGYDNHEIVLFDDFDGIKSGITFRKLLQLTDRYPLTVPVKGAFVPWLPKKIYITTNIHPRGWYPDEDCAPLFRRIDRFFKFAGRYPDEVAVEEIDLE